MSDTGHRIVLSVRGEAQRTVAPDRAVFHWSTTATADSKAAATGELQRLLARTVADLAALHGQLLTEQTERAPLTWSTQSLHTEPEHGLDKATGIHGPTGRHIARANSTVVVRDFALLDRVEQALTRYDDADLYSVQWGVDHDNAAWAAVRADAIAAAVAKGRDYAAALRGTVVSVDHVADAGLLGGAGGDVGSLERMPRRSAAVSLSMSGGGDVSSTDPVPQVVAAVIEARLTAAVEPLTG